MIERMRRYVYTEKDEQIEELHGELENYVRENMELRLQLVKMYHRGYRDGLEDAGDTDE